MALRAKIKNKKNKKKTMCRNSRRLDYFTRGLPEVIISYVIIRKPGILDSAIRYAIISCIQQIEKYKQV